MWPWLSDDAPTKWKTARQSRFGCFQGQTRCKHFARSSGPESRILLDMRISLRHGQAGCSPRVSSALILPTQLFEPAIGPRLKVSDEILNGVPPNVKDTVTSASQGTDLPANQFSTRVATTRQRTRPGSVWSRD